MALINPNFTPVHLVRDAELIIVLELKPADEESRVPSEIKRCLKGEAPAQPPVVDLSATQKAEDGRTARELVGGPDREVLSWSGALPELYGMIQIDRNSGDLMLAILGIIVAMGVLNTVLMSVLERTREFGVMFALGMKPRQVASLVLLEGAVLGACGAAIGLVLGLLFSWPMVEYGIDFSSYAGGAESMDMAGISVESVIKGQINPWRTSVYVVGTVVFTTLAALYPAIHVARLKPVDAIHHT